MGGIALRPFGIAVAWLVASCDCYDSRTGDAGAGADVEQGDAADRDAAPDGSAPRDAGDLGDAGDGGGDAGSEDRRCSREVCALDQPYCCAMAESEFPSFFCSARPAVWVHGSGDRIWCTEFPVEPFAVEQTCSDGDPCPIEMPFCCSRLFHADHCSTSPLFGWDCVDLDGRAAADTDRTLWPQDIRRCAEDQPCPGDRPYCCDDLFCVPEPWYGWDCE